MDIDQEIIDRYVQNKITDFVMLFDRMVMAEYDIDADWMFRIEVNGPIVEIFPNIDKSTNPTNGWYNQPFLRFKPGRYVDTKTVLTFTSLNLQQNLLFACNSLADRDVISLFFRQAELWRDWVKGVADGK